MTLPLCSKCGGKTIIEKDNRIYIETKETRKEDVIVCLKCLNPEKICKCKSQEEEQEDTNKILQGYALCKKH